MRYKEIMEQTKEPDNKEIKKIILRDCQPYLKMINSKPSSIFMFSGIEPLRVQPSLWKRKVRLNDRLSSDSGQSLHNHYNTYFTKKFGEPFRNAAFVTGDIKFADGYGEAHVMFPIGNFTFLWSRDIRDMYEYMNGMLGHEGEIPDEEEIFAILDDVHYSTTDLITAIKSKHEIMIRCKELWAVHEDKYEEIDWKLK